MDYANTAIIGLLLSAAIIAGRYFGRNTIRQTISSLIFAVVDSFPPPAVTEPEPRKNQRTLARLRLCRMQMRKKGMLSTKAKGAYTPPPMGESVQVLWNHYGWVPPHGNLQLKPAAPEIEITQEVDTQEARREVVAIKRRAAK